MHGFYIHAEINVQKTEERESYSTLQGLGRVLSHLTCPGQQASKQARALKVPHGLKVLLTLSHIKNPGQGGLISGTNGPEQTEFLRKMLSQPGQFRLTSLITYVR